ncbi:MAG TPA: GlsB/YeaQ/YmgE family stress response membrane protein [Rubricoccaceae bacterium]|nr:GlsB/YeaQ/YmgE family stress response membrane protein [Rubricoccaceae bacterium]
MTLLLIIIVGGLIGWLASKIMGTDPQQGILMNVIIGIVGAVIAGFIADALDIGDEGTILQGDFDIVSLLISLVGAVILIWLWKMIAGRRPRV